MKAEGMTIREIGELCGVGESTVKDWIKAGTESGAAETETGARIAAIMAKSGHGKAAKFDLPMVLFIIRAGGRGLLADLLAENARMFEELGGVPSELKSLSREQLKAGAAVTILNTKFDRSRVKASPRLPAGIQLQELRLHYKLGILSARQIQTILGVAPSLDTASALPGPRRLEERASDAEGERAFAALRDAFPAGGLPRGTVERVVGAAAGAARKTLEAIDREVRTGALQGGLF